MPRKLRVEYPGAIYHVMSRGDGKGDIFLDDVDRQDFLKTLAEACLKTGFQVHAPGLWRTPQQEGGSLSSRWKRGGQRETTLTIRQIAERLHLGSWKSLNNNLYLRSQGKGKRNKV